MSTKGDIVYKIQEVDPGEYEDLILTLGALSEIVAWNGYEILERIYQGSFDEADLRREEIPLAYRSKVKLELIRNEFFGELIFAFGMIEDHAFACRLIGDHIMRKNCSEKECCELVLEYYGMCMIYKKRLPWEIEYHLQNVVGQSSSLKKCMAGYKREGETYMECVQRYRSHWQEG